ncbi:glycosyltransferase [Maribacter sp. PR1]|uniref:Glycosyltransferase n=1 Tax=Maribacter cobaltidurans TaxID=1178778 RepID=A0ABU7IW64_9FLAO|nr:MULTISPECIES: glycosyltransferase [Maribacter]MDC6389679.1 glycosyltransferase [Maribacter sp. PR1]MEE1977068.1 glycosyltransferase [Maribacter cobaltidurans]
MESALVSILIPFKNTSEYLNECLSSILNQSYTHWEVISVDDHSKDESLEIVEEFSRKDSRIKVLFNSGKGVIAALRTGYAESRGTLITRMDSDDMMTPNRLETMVVSLKKNGSGHVAVGQVKYFSSRGISNGYDRYEKWLNKLTAEGKNYDEIYKECVIPSPCWMVHRTDFENCGGFQPDRYPEDYDLTFRFYEKGLNVIPCEQVLLLWRDYDYRTSRTSELYAQNYFLDIKLHYFLKLDYVHTRPLVVWGAGNKGKKIAKSLLKKGIDFEWICDNPNKIGKNIYGKEMLSFQVLETMENSQSIITVANENAQREIRSYFQKKDMFHMADYFFFC